jgi:hypothetical protein
MNRVTAKVDKPLVGANLQAHLDGLRDQMRKAAENLEFEEAARLRDEIKRLETVELAVADDPLARQSAVERGGGGAVELYPRQRDCAGTGPTHFRTETVSKGNFLHSSGPERTPDANRDRSKGVDQGAHAVGIPTRRICPGRLSPLPRRARRSTRGRSSSACHRGSS